jgi:protein SCO1/2
VSKLNKHKTLLYGIILIAIPALAFAAVTMLQNRYEKLPVYDSTLNTNNEDRTPHFVQPFTLINQDGKVFSDADVNNKIYVADFFFTSCTSACPKMTKNLLLVQKEFSNDNNIRLISFTVDPETDSAQRLKWYAGVFKIDPSKWNLLTGDKKEIYKLARESFYVSAGDGDGGPDDFIHSDKLVLIDKQKQIRGYYTGTDESSVKQLIHDIKKLENEN